MKNTYKVFYLRLEEPPFPVNENVEFEITVITKRGKKVTGKYYVNEIEDNSFLDDFDGFDNPKKDSLGPPYYRVRDVMLEAIL